MSPSKSRRRICCIGSCSSTILKVRKIESGVGSEFKTQLQSFIPRYYLGTCILKIKEVVGRTWCGVLFLEVLRYYLGMEYLVVSVQ